MALGENVPPRWRRIRKVLHTDWDPIGAGCPEDEYDAYVGKVAALLDFGASDQELIAYLHEVETVDMSLLAQPDAKLKRVVDALRATARTDREGR